MVMSAPLASLPITEKANATAMHAEPICAAFWQLKPLHGEATATARAYRRFIQTAKTT
jgi:hypothetical protein